MYSTVLQVLGINSSAYDMRLIRKHFPKVFSDDAKNGDMTNLQVVNGTKGFMVVCNGALRFLDWYNKLDVTPMVLDVCGISPMTSYCIYIKCVIYTSAANLAL